MLSLLEEAPLTFELVQLASGSLVVHCEAESLADYFEPNSQAILRGTTDEGADITIDIRLVTRQQRQCSEGCLKLILHMICRDATVSCSTERIVSFRYSVTNLALFWNEMRMSIEDHEVVVRPLPDAREMLDEVKGLEGIAVTAQATVTADIEAREAVDQMMDRLCLLFSLAQGHNVMWVCRDSFDAEGQVVDSYCRDATTKPWSSEELIPRHAIKEFVFSTYPRYRIADERWDLKRAILALTDARIGTDHLEARALKMVVVMEHLRGRYLRRTEGEHIVPKRDFDRRNKELQKRMAPILEELFAGHSQEKITAMVNKVRELNRRSFEKALSALCEDLGIVMNKKDRRHFVDIRNALVHRAAFLNKPQPWEQYSFLATVIGKILLAILGWEGEYRDWSKDPNKPERLTLRKAL